MFFTWLFFLIIFKLYFFYFSKQILILKNKYFRTPKVYSVTHMAHTFRYVTILDRLNFIQFATKKFWKKKAMFNIQKLMPACLILSRRAPPRLILGSLPNLGINSRSWRGRSDFEVISPCPILMESRTPVKTGDWNPSSQPWLTHTHTQ